MVCGTTLLRIYHLRSARVIEVERSNKKRQSRGRKCPDTRVAPEGGSPISALDTSMVRQPSGTGMLRSQLVEASG